MTDKSFDDVGVGRYAVHPLPPAKVLVRLQNAIAIIRSETSQAINKTRETYKVTTKLKKKPNNCPAIAGFGDMAATHSAMVV